LLKIDEINDLTEIKNTIIQERAKQARNGKSQEYVAKFNGSESAFLSFEDWSDKSLGFIFEIFVLPDFREQGIGAELLLYAESLAMKLGCSVIQLEPYAFDRSVSSEWLVSWYRKKGYNIKASDTEKMEKTLSTKQCRRLE